MAEPLTYNTSLPPCAWQERVWPTSRHGCPIVTPALDMWTWPENDTTETVGAAYHSLSTPGEGVCATTYARPNSFMVFPESQSMSFASVASDSTVHDGVAMDGIGSMAMSSSSFDQNMHEVIAWYRRAYCEGMLENPTTWTMSPTKQLVQNCGWETPDTRANSDQWLASDYMPLEQRLSLHGQTGTFRIF